MEILTLINEIIKQIRELFELLTSKPDTTIDEIETKVHQIVIEIGRQLTQVIVNSHGTGYTHRLIKTPSGEEATFKGYEKRTIGTLMGDAETMNGNHFGLSIELSIECPPEWPCQVFCVSFHSATFTNTC